MKGDDRSDGSGVLTPFAGIAFLWLIAAVRGHIGDREWTITCLP